MFPGFKYYVEKTSNDIELGLQKHFKWFHFYHDFPLKDRALSK